MEYSYLSLLEPGIRNEPGFRAGFRVQNFDFRVTGSALGYGSRNFSELFFETKKNKKKHGTADKFGKAFENFFSRNYLVIKVKFEFQNSS